MAFPHPHPLAGLLTALTFVAPPNTLNLDRDTLWEREGRRWHQRLTRTRDPRRLRFTAEGVRLANNVLIPWTPDAALLPALPQVLTAVRDVRLRFWTGGCMSEDVGDVFEALDARDLLPKGPVPWGWWQSCPAHGSPLCDLGSPTGPRDSCLYCHGDGMLFREPNRAADADALVFLAAFGAARVEAALGAVKELGSKVKRPVDRVVWEARHPEDRRGSTVLEAFARHADDREVACALVDEIVRPTDATIFGFRPRMVRRGVAVVEMYRAPNYPLLDLRRRLPSLEVPTPAELF